MYVCMRGFFNYICVFCVFNDYIIIICTVPQSCVDLISSGFPLFFFIIYL